MFCLRNKQNKSDYSLLSDNLSAHVVHLGPELQCLLRVKEDLSLVLIFQDAKNNV